MAWYLFYKKDTGDMVSEGSTVPTNLDTAVYGVLDVGTRPVWSLTGWNPTQRALYTLPLPVLIDRIDDLNAWMQADTDFAAVWQTLSTARKTQIRQGIGRVLARFVGGLRFRQADDPVEVG